MRALRMAAHATIAVGVLAIGASCTGAERLTSPGADGADGTDTPTLGTTYGSTQIDVKPDSENVPLGSARQLTVDIGETKQVKAAVLWSSLDSSVATVTGSGIVTGLKKGKARIVGKVGPSVDTATVVVTTTVASVVATPESGELTVGQTAQLSAVANDALGQPLSGVTMQWSSLNPTVATVSSSGLVTGVATGDAKIVASASTKADTVSVHVSAVAVASVTLSPTTLALSVGATGQLTATALSATGAPLNDRLATWASSDEAIARVSSTGLVTAVAPGTATVSATIDGRKVSATVTVKAAVVASLTVTANTANLTVGQTTQLTATPRDAAGAVLSGRTVTWASSDANVATVSSTGLVTAAGPGTATITGTSEGVSASVTITVKLAAVASVAVSVNAASITVGQTTQANASAFDATGQPLVGRAVTWSTNPASIATISPSGVVSGVAAGTVVVTGTVEGKSGSVTMTILPLPVVGSPTPVPTKTIAPELPRAVPDVSVPAVTGTSIRVAAGQSLQTALDNARPGDELVLDAGATFVGNFVLRAKGGDGWITIRSSAAIPAAGTRVTPSTAASFAKIQTNNVMPALSTEAGVHHVRLAGLDIGAAPGVGKAYSLVALGDASTAQTSASQAPHHLLLDHVYVHGNSTLDVRRCVAMNSAWTAVVDSWLAECHSNDGDAQAVWGSNGPGPFLIENNRLEGSGENIMFGGADSRATDLMPSDITIRRNHIIKPMVWLGKWMAKNLLELKVGKRVLIEGNVLENSWVSGQTGFAFVLWSVNQDNSAPWSETADVTVQYNLIRHATNAFQLTDKYWGTSAPVMARVAIRHNIITDIGQDGTLGPGGGRMFQASGAIADLAVMHNTSGSAGPWVYFVTQPITTLPRMTAADNISFRSEIALRSDYGNGTTAWDSYAGSGGGAIMGNVLAAAVGGIPTNNTAPVGTSPDATSAIGFMNPAGGNYRLGSSSPFKGKATDGTDPGANQDSIDGRISGVIVQP